MSAKNEKILAELQVNKLPSLPHVLVEMLEACQGNRASFQNMSVIIGRDAAVAARVVSLANSSFYNRGTQINSLERALFVLGTDTIKTIVITASIQQFFSGFNQAQSDHLKHFWRHSLATALISKSLAILTSYPNPDEAYLTGLLHNIGELVLETNFPKQYCDIINEATSAERAGKEDKLFNINHASIGAYLAKNWKLSEFAVDAIEFHHAPTHAIRDAHHLVKLTYLAGMLSETTALQNQASLDAAESLFELNGSLVHEIVNKINSEVHEISKSLGIDIDSNSSVDHDKQIQLARQVRNIGLLQSAASELNSANSKQELGRAFQNSLELLFGYRDSAIFWFSPDEEELSHLSFEDADGAGIKFKLDDSSSIIAKSAQNKKILSTYDKEASLEELPVVDLQIIRLLKSKGIICIPIFSQSTLFCVLVAAIDRPLTPQSSQKLLLQYFSNEIVSACEETLSQIKARNSNLSTQELTERAHEIAHEANNPLNIISNYLVTLGSKLSNNSEVQEELSILKEEVERTGSILLRLKDLQHTQHNIEDETDINLEISRLIKLYKNSLFLTHSIHCDIDLDENLLSHFISRNSLRQILTNLIKNAVEAQVGGGSITIATSACVNVNGLDFVEIRLRDTGPGIHESVLKELFKPTTSTKGEGHSGLGLSITKNLVAEVKGSISCRSSKRGTEFQILLPIKNTKHK